MKRYDELAYYRERKKLINMGHTKACAEYRLRNWDWLKEFKAQTEIMRVMTDYIESMVYEG